MVIVTQATLKVSFITFYYEMWWFNIYLFLKKLLAEFDHQIRKSQAKALVTVPELLPVLSKVAVANNIPKERIFLFGNETVDGCKPYKSLASDVENRQFPLQAINPSQDLAFICFSSGTTGVAKGVMLTHTNFVSQILLVTEFEGTDPNQKNDRIIGFLPFYHIFGLTTLVLRAFYSVTPVVIIPKYELERVCQLIEKYKITIGPIVPPVGKVFLNVGKKKRLKERKYTKTLYSCSFCKEPHCYKVWSFFSSLH